MGALINDTKRTKQFDSLQLSCVKMTASRYPREAAQQYKREMIPRNWKNCVPSSVVIDLQCLIMDEQMGSFFLPEKGRSFANRQYIYLRQSSLGES